MVRYKKEEREQFLSRTRQLLLDSAAEEFAHKGYAEANINHISKSAGFAKGTIYNYFASKEELFLDLLVTTAEQHIEEIIAYVNQEDDSRRRLERFFEAGFAFVSQNLARTRVLINTTYGPNPDFKLQLYQAYQSLFQYVSREIVALGIDEGIFREVEPNSMGTLLMTIYLGTASQVSEDGQIWLDPKEVADFAWHALRKSNVQEAGNIS